MNNPALEQYIDRFHQYHLGVIGDLVLDEYLIGNAFRLSREAPIPVLEFEERRVIPGGAANPAMNLRTLGADVTQFGVVGADNAGTTLLSLLQAQAVQTAGTVLVDETRQTTLKTRIMAQMGLRFPQQVARIDRVTRDALNPGSADGLAVALERHAADCHALLFSDYRGGVIQPQHVRLAHSLRQVNPGLLLTADAQGNFDAYHAFDVVKCNADEAAAFLNRELATTEDFAAAARDLYAALQLARGMVITRGGAGAVVAGAQGVAHCPAPVVTDVFDTVGAGDTAIAVMTLALCAGAPLEDAVMLANFASGLVVRRVGNYCPSTSELRAALMR